MLHRLAGIEDEYQLVEASLSDPSVVGDQRALRDASRRYKEMTPLIECLRELRARQADADAATELLDMAEGEERTMLREEAHLAQVEIERLNEALKLHLLPKDPNDGRNVLVEIRGAEGGDEANLFARDLYEMYQGYATRHGWAFDVMSIDASDLGGLNQITFELRGDTAWQRMKFEGGPHRVQRVPVTESQGRIHTSSATVLVLPEAEEVDVDIDDKDLQVDVYRSSGAGGQHVNTTDSAVRITHKPSGIVVTMQDERSQLQNRAKAMVVLRSRLLQQREEERAAVMSVERRSQVGGGGRSEKIRTYNYKESRVTDHRIGFTIYRLHDVLLGDLDDVVDALLADERTRQLESGE